MRSFLSSMSSKLLAHSLCQPQTSGETKEIEEIQYTPHIREENNNNNPQKQNISSYFLGACFVICFFFSFSHFTYQVSIIRSSTDSVTKKKEKKKQRRKIRVRGQQYKAPTRCSYSDHRTKPRPAFSPPPQKPRKRSLCFPQCSALNGCFLFEEKRGKMKSHG